MRKTIRRGGNRRVWVAFLAFALLFVLMASSVSAQSNGTILGVVKDASGGTVPQANITVMNAAKSMALKALDIGA